jgi:hypothetical protein
MTTVWAVCWFDVTDILVKCKDSEELSDLPLQSLQTFGWTQCVWVVLYAAQGCCICTCRENRLAGLSVCGLCCTSRVMPNECKPRSTELFYLLLFSRSASL